MRLISRFRQPSRRAWRIAFRAAVTTAAAALLLWAARRFDAAPALLAATRRLGVTGLASLAALQILSFAADAASLRLSAGRPMLGHGLRPYLRACVVAQSVNTFTPFGQLGEAFKARALASQLPPDQRAGAVLRHNYLMAAGSYVAVAAGLAAGAGLLSPGGRALGLAAAAAFLALAALTVQIMVHGIGAPGQRAIAAIGRRFRRLDSACATLLRIERASRPSPGQSARLLTGLSLTIAKRLLLVVEAIVILRALSCQHTVVLGLVTQSSAQLIAWATSFVPGQLGTAEGGGLLLFQTLSLSAQLGLAFELVRRGRRMLVATLGLAWL